MCLYAVNITSDKKRQKIRVLGWLKKLVFKKKKKTEKSGGGKKTDTFHQAFL